MIMSSLPMEFEGVIQIKRPRERLNREALGWLSMEAELLPHP